MLPIQLSIKNFLSYREAAPVLMLEDIHVACLCGPNGNGKSALLDAITWALWGRARGQRTDQLLHHGQNEMVVELVFDISGNRYRASRRYSKARSTPQSSLELYMQNSDSSYTPITGDSITVTQSMIIRILNMDYDTFINSAFLVQGRADAFTMASPTQRKEVLTKVLGLGLYDRLEDRAKAHARDRQSQLATFSSLGLRLESQVANHSEKKITLSNIKTKIIEVNQSEADLLSKLYAANSQIVELEQLQASKQDKEDSIKRFHLRQNESEAELNSVELQIKTHTEILSQSESIVKGYTELQTTRNAYHSVNATAQKVLALQVELRPLEKIINEARVNLEAEVSSNNRILQQELRPKIESLPFLESELKAITIKIEKLNKQLIDLSELHQRNNELFKDIESLKQQNSHLSTEGNATKEKLHLLDHSHSSKTSCPLCETLLTEDGIEKLRKIYQNTIESQRAIYLEKESLIKSKESTFLEFEQEYNTSYASLTNSVRNTERTRGELQSQINDVNNSVEIYDALRSKITEAENALINKNYALEEQTKLETLQARIEALNFNPNLISFYESKIAQLLQWEQPHEKLNLANLQLDEDIKLQDSLKARLVDTQNDLAKAKEELKVIDEKSQVLPSLLSQKARIEADLQNIQFTKTRLLNEEGSVSQELREIEQAQLELKKLEYDRKEIATEASIYSELALSFGKGGVQALLIEAAIPRLEDEANELLHRMSDGKMSVKLETQRQRKSASINSDVAETLEIIVADELGTRSYEMFSGGERFRVDFAIRIALSKLLAWRSGAPLPTLFIDEGFGTQDAEGRDKIIDVLKAIEDRFERIIVITHLDAIKEAFPVRIEVSRTVNGSTFAVT